MCKYTNSGGEGSYISLEFTEMDTECSYDYLFIFDGLSYSAPMLGSFSGDSLPYKVLASSGYVSVFLWLSEVLKYIHIKFIVTLAM